MSAGQSCRLYLITPPKIPDLAAFALELEKTLQAVVGTPAEVACIQLRLKHVEDREILLAAERLLPLAHHAGAALLVNDRPDLAQKSGSDGTHIGQADMPLAEAREILGPDASIGVTCHNSTHLAMEAGEAGADYVAFGAFFQTVTKEVEHRADPEILSFWHNATTVPSVAIGGITPINGTTLVAAGADFLAVSGAIWNHSDGPVAGIKEFIPLLA